MPDHQYTPGRIQILVIAILAFLIPVFFIVFNILQQTGGVFSYPLDDSFIHLAMAKNLAFNHVWGVYDHEFVSASSSISYPLILAFIVTLFGAPVILPLVTNIFAAILLLVIIQKWLEEKEVKPFHQIIILLAVILLTPLPVIVVCAMEDTIYLIFCFLFITHFSGRLDALIKSGASKWKLHWPIYLYGAMVTATRFEGSIFIAMACMLLLLHKKWLLSFRLAILSMLPVLIFGIISLLHHNYFLPNSVLLKADGPTFTLAGIYQYFSDYWLYKLSFSAVGYNAIAPQRLLLFLPVAYLLFLATGKKEGSWRFMVLFLAAALLAHISFARFARFPRYEACIMGCSTAILGALLSKNGMALLKRSSDEAKYAAITGICLLLFPLYMRSVGAFENISQSCVNIYDQQYQMAIFLHRYYDSTTVAISDIGAVSYFTKSKKVDLTGLANIQVTRSRRDLTFTTDFADRLTQQEKAQIAILYERYNDPVLLNKWQKIATWQIPNNIICGDDLVTFYAIDKNIAPDLRKNLAKFQPSLPPGVTVEYF